MKKNDLPVLFSAFGDHDDAIKRIILELSVSRIDIVIGNIKNIHLDILRYLLSVDSINESQRVDIILSFIPIASCHDVIIEFLYLSKLDEFAKLFKKHGQPRIPFTAVNERFLASLKELGFLNDYSKDSKVSGCYKIEKKKQMKSSVN